MADNDIEFVTVQHQVTLAVGTFVNCLQGHFNAAEMCAGKITQEFVMVSGDVDDACALARLSEQFLYNVIAVLRPVPAAPEPPTVNNVADKDNLIGFVIAQEVDEIIRFRGL